MAVALEELVAGAVFRFKAGARRIVGRRNETDRGYMVEWAYADGKPRRGKTSGSQWCHYFRREAIERIPAGEDAAETVQLLPDRRTVAKLAEPVTINITTRKPSRWAFVDLETGDVWAHTGEKFAHMSAQQCEDVAHVVSGTARVRKG